MVIGYLRVSTGKQHPANQKEEISRFAEKGDPLIVTEISRLSRTLTEIMSIMGNIVAGRQLDGDAYRPAILCPLIMGIVYVLLFSVGNMFVPMMLIILVWGLPMGSSTTCSSTSSYPYRWRRRSSPTGSTSA